MRPAPARIIRDRHAISTRRDSRPRPSRGRAAPEAEDQHGEGNLRQILPLRGEEGGGAQGRPHARAPHRAEQEADGELAREAGGRDPAEASLQPVAQGSARGGETDLQGGHDEDDSDENEQERRHRAEHVAVDTEAEPNGRHEQAERHEGQGEPRPPRAAGPKRCSEAAAPKTMGSSGSTQGERIVSRPGEEGKAQGRIHVRDVFHGRDVCMTGMPAGFPTPFYSAFSTRDSIHSPCVSPTERPISWPPLKTMRVLCMRASNRRISAFCVSKSIS